MIKRLLALSVALLLSAQCFAAVDVYEFSSEVDRERYQMFLEELRCPKCKNNNLAGTNSQIAVDLRRELHRLVSEGRSDEEIVNFMVSRYGDFVLYRPRVQGNTIALWTAPFVFMLIGGVTVGAIVWRRRKVVSAGKSPELSPEEQARLDELLTKSGKSPK